MLVVCPGQSSDFLECKTCLHAYPHERIYGCDGDRLCAAWNNQKWAARLAENFMRERMLCVAIQDYRKDDLGGRKL